MSDRTEKKLWLVNFLAFDSFYLHPGENNLPCVFWVIFSAMDGTLKSLDIQISNLSICKQSRCFTFQSKCCTDSGLSQSVGENGKSHPSACVLLKTEPPDFCFRKQPQQLPTHHNSLTTHNITNWNLHPPIFAQICIRLCLLIKVSFLIKH